MAGRFSPTAVTASILAVREGGAGHQSPSKQFQQPFSYEEPSMTTSFIKSIASLAAAAGLLTATAAFAGGNSGGNHSASMHNNSGNISSNKFLSNTIKTNNQFIGTNNLSSASHFNSISDKKNLTSKNLNLFSNKDHIVNTNTINKHINNNILHNLNDKKDHPKFDLKKDNHLFDKSKKDHCKYPWFDCKKSYCWDKWCNPYYFGCYYPHCYDYSFPTCFYSTCYTLPTYETVSYTPVNVVPLVESSRTQVAIGSTLLINGQAFGNLPGGARLRITSMALPIQVVEWTPNAVKVMVPPVELTGVTPAEIELILPDGTLAAKMPVELIPSPQGLAIGR